MIRFDLERSAGPGLREQATGLLKLAFVTLDTGGAYREALCYRIDDGAFLTKGIHNPLSKIYRVGLHEPHYPPGQC